MTWKTQAFSIGSLQSSLIFVLWPTLSKVPMMLQPQSQAEAIRPKRPSPPPGGVMLGFSIYLCLRKAEALPSITVAPHRSVLQEACSQTEKTVPTEATAVVAPTFYWASWSMCYTICKIGTPLTSKKHHLHREVRRLKWDDRVYVVSCFFF